MTKPNILWIMADQLRWDYLSCYGHPTLKTPNIDALAERGVKFDKAYVNAAVCGPSRMCYYTGRHMSSHGSTWNGVPLRVGEPTLGDHMRDLGYRVALVGKTHMTADETGMKRLGIPADSYEGVLAREVGFEPYERDDGLHPDGIPEPDLPYNVYLRDQGYEGQNPWHTAANAGVDEAGNVLSGWLMRNAAAPAVVADAHSETAYMTNRAMDFMREAEGTPWLLHLSFIKPHWPYIVSPPYHDMFGPEDMLPVSRSAVELENPNAVYTAYRDHIESTTFSDENVRNSVVPIYMGLIKQMDDHLGRLFAFMRETGLDKTTVVVMSSDHGDYLGDHWLGEKELFHEQSARVPLIILDPRPEADESRGTAYGDLVQGIDLAATFVDMAGGGRLDHILEGTSLTPVLAGGGIEHAYVVSELDYSFRPASVELPVEPHGSRAYMLRTGPWKYVFYEGFGEQLFNLEDDPAEFTDLGRAPETEALRHALRGKLADWRRDRRMRITMSDEAIKDMRARGFSKIGVHIGEW